MSTCGLSRLKILIFLFALASFSSFAQYDLPENGHAFLQEEVARIDVIIHPDSFDLMITDTDYGSSNEFQSSFIYSTSFSSDTLENIGFRLRGNTSLQAEKKSFKISFNSFQNGLNFHGLEKLNLNGEHNDVSLMRSKLSWEMIRNIGAVGSRTSYIELYVNNQYRGLYLNVEHIDEEFIKKYRNEKVGNLYKCLYPATLEFLGNNPDAYKLEAWGQRVYDLKTNKGEDDYNAFAQFVGILNTTPDATFDCEIERVFNPDDFLKYAAIDVLIGNWDGYIVNKNNFYLYENTETGQMEYFPYDLDNTWGIDWFGVDWASTPLYQWNFEDRPLYERMMETPELREQFSFYIDQLLQSEFLPSNVLDRANEIQSLIAPYIQSDPFYPLDYGFTYQDFLDAIDEAWGDHIQQSIGEYVEERHAFASNALELYNEPLIGVYAKDSMITINTKKIEIRTESIIDSVIIVPLENFAPVGYFPMTNEGNGIYTYVHTCNEDFFEYFCYLYRNGQQQEFPCGLKLSWTSESDLDFSINEVMSLNSNTVSDQYGEFDDWLELYNGSSNAIDMTEFWLTDELCFPQKWRLPEISISNEGFLLLWADDQPEQADDHMNFRVDSQGETIYLFTKEVGAYRLVDSVSVPLLSLDQAYGRAEDGQGLWINMETATPGSTNNPSSLQDLVQNELSVFPNPSSTVVTINNDQPCELSVLDMQGKVLLIKEIPAFYDLNVEQWAKGLYQFQLINEGGISTIPFLKD